MNCPDMITIVVKGTPTQTQLHQVLIKQILISLQRTHSNSLVVADPELHSGRTTWVRAIFENHSSLIQKNSYNLWEQLPRHPVPICRVTKPLPPELLKYNQVELPGKATANPQDRLISLAIISCLDDDQEEPSPVERFSLVTEYTQPKKKAAPLPVACYPQPLPRSLPLPKITLPTAQ